MPELQSMVKKTERSADEYVDMLLGHFNSTQNEAFIRMNREEITRDEFMNIVSDYLQKLTANKSQELRNEVIDKFKSYLWGFSVLEGLINDPTVSDIRVMAYDNIRIKRNGERMDGGVKFASLKEYKIFVDSIATRNAINLSMLNAAPTFVDNDSHPDMTLRFTIITEMLTAPATPYMHIRKLPKKHRTLLHFEKKGLLITDEQIEYFKNRIAAGDSFLITGKTGAGKTILYNGLLDFIPRDKSVYIVQENDELNNECDEKGYEPHPEMMFLHTLYASGEGKVQYDLKDISRVGLLFDADVFAVGEVKGGEAKYLPNFIKTGCQAFCTGHGSSVKDGMDKLADYVTYDSDYTKAEALEELQRLNTVIYVDNFEVKEIAEVTGYDREKEKLIYKPVEP